MNSQRKRLIGVIIFLLVGSGGLFLRNYFNNRSGAYELSQVENEQKQQVADIEQGALTVNLSSDLVSYVNARNSNAIPPDSAKERELNALIKTTIGTSSPNSSS